MATYVVGDIHGCFAEWMDLKDRIEKEDRQAQFILLGDIVDRGPEVMRMLEWAMKNITPDGRYQMIMGNHEWMKVPWMDRYFELVENARAEGREFTLEEMEPGRYDFHEWCLKCRVTEEQLRRIRSWMANLPYYKERDVILNGRKQHFLILHGGIEPGCLNRDETFKKHSISGHRKNAEKRKAAENLRWRIVWNRPFYGNEQLQRTIVIHGHTPTIAEELAEGYVVPGMICYNVNDINIDCGMVYRKDYVHANLAAIRLEDLQEFYAYPCPAEDVDNEGYQLNIQLKEDMLLHRTPGCNRRLEFMQKKREALQ